MKKSEALYEEEPKQVQATTTKAHGSETTYSNFVSLNA